MEFENNTPVNDEQRHRAEARQLNIKPLNTALQPDEPSEESTAARHLRSQAIANAPNDIEQDFAAIQPTPSLVSPTASKKAPSLRTVRTGMIGAVIFLAIIMVAVIFYALS